MALIDLMVAEQQRRTLFQNGMPGAARVNSTSTEKSTMTCIPNSVASGNTLQAWPYAQPAPLSSCAGDNLLIDRSHRAHVAAGGAARLENRVEWSTEWREADPDRTPFVGPPAVRAGGPIAELPVGRELHLRDDLSRAQKVGRAS